MPIPSDMDGRVLSEVFEEDPKPKRRKPRIMEASKYTLALRLKKIKRRRHH